MSLSWLKPDGLGGIIYLVFLLRWVIVAKALAMVSCLAPAEGGVKLIMSCRGASVGLVIGAGAVPMTGLTGDSPFCRAAAPIWPPAGVPVRVPRTKYHNRDITSIPYGPYLWNTWQYLRLGRHPAYCISDPRTVPLALTTKSEKVGLPYHRKCDSSVLLRHTFRTVW